MTVYEWQRRLRASRRLTPKAKLVGLVVSLRADWDELTAWPSVARIARESSLSESSVHRALRELKRTHYLHVTFRGKRGRNLSNLYRLTVPGVRWDDEDEWDDDDIRW